MESRNFVGDWAEETLLQAERAVTLMGTPRPDWVDRDYYETNIIQEINFPTSSKNENSSLFPEMRLILVPFLLSVAVLVLCKLSKIKFCNNRKQVEYTAIP